MDSPLIVTYAVNKTTNRKRPTAEDQSKAQNRPLAGARLCAVIASCLPTVFNEVDVGVDEGIMTFLSSKKFAPPAWTSEQSAELKQFHMKIDMLQTRQSVCDAVMLRMEDMADDESPLPDLMRGFMDRWRDTRWTLAAKEEGGDTGRTDALRVEFDIVSTRSIWNSPLTLNTKKQFMTPEVVTSVLGDFLPSIMAQVTLGIEDALCDFMFNSSAHVSAQQYDLPPPPAERETRIDTDLVRASVHKSMIHKLYRIIDDHTAAVISAEAYEELHGV